jgi:hypothetical protein
VTVRARSARFARTVDALIQSLFSAATTAFASSPVDRVDRVAGRSSMVRVVAGCWYVGASVVVIRKSFV